MDDTLLFRRDVLGQFSMHLERVAKGLSKRDDPYIATADHVKPRPHFFLEPSSTFVYLRPGVKEALDYARAHASSVHAFSAASDAEAILAFTGLCPYFEKVFPRDGFTTFAIREGTPVRLKNLESVRKDLGLRTEDKVYVFDDRPEWIVPSGPNDHVISVAPFQPAYSLYGVRTIPGDTLSDTELMTKVVAALAAI
jgi:hypothetical protein